MAIPRPPNPTPKGRDWMKAIIAASERMDAGDKWAMTRAIFELASRREERAAPEREVGEDDD